MSNISHSHRLLNFLFSLLLTPIFLLILIPFFLLSRFLEIITFPFRHSLKVPPSKTKLNGISIIIPTWNKKDLIVNCLQLLDKALTQIKNIPTEIIIIENGSTDGSLAAIQKLPLQTPLIILPQTHNLGFARAINLATQKAHYNYLYLMNNDMEVKENTFPPLIKFASRLITQNQKFFALASQIHFFDPQKQQQESGKTYLTYHFGFIQVAHVIDELNLTQASPTLYAGGGSSLFNKYLFTKLGGFDHRSYRPLYVEDLDLSFTAWQLGFPSYFCATSHITHHHRQSSNQLKPSPDFLIHQNFLVFIWKHLTNFSSILTHLLFYPPRMMSQPSSSRYFRTALPALPAIFFSRLRLLFYKRHYSTKKLLNFTDFELTLPSLPQ
jgi:GT2 family glycosyltransferase